MHVRVLYHGNCLDGCSSAGLFARFFQERIDQGAVEVAFTPLEHRGPGPAIAPELFDGDVNACVDFRYSQDPRLHWWFDHHISAFQAPGDQAHFLAHQTGQKFYDPTARSCARFLARTVAERFGFDPAPLSELLEWVEIVDGALFPDARMPVELKEPALRLMLWAEQNRDLRLADRFIHDLITRPLADIAASPYVAEPLAPLLDQQSRDAEMVKRHARLQKDVVVLDLLDEGSVSLNKFIAYHLFPDCRYSVALSRGEDRLKISVGSNPWSPTARTHNIASLCERYGGGGHPVVGAISLPLNEPESARQISRELIAALVS